MAVLVVLASLLGAPGEQIVTGITDSAITTQINGLYLLNEHLNPFNIITTTNNGHVMLSGSVNDEIQKQLAEDLALGVRGVVFVDNRLVVINTVIGEKERRTWRERAADRALSAAVKSRMLLEGEFKGLRIGITAINSVITLSGVVPTEEHAEAMVRVAEETRGVADVVNNLTIHKKEEAYDIVRGTGRNIADEWIESRVATTIRLNRHLSIRELRVEVDDGICFLNGSVNSEEKKELAGQIADSIRGVVEVRNNIIVREGGEVVEPETDWDDPVGRGAPEPAIVGSEPLEDDFLTGSTPGVEKRPLADP